MTLQKEKRALKDPPILERSVKLRCFLRPVRLEIIKNGLLAGKTWKQLAIDCRCDRSTIARDMRLLRDDPNFESWLKRKWIAVLGDVMRENPGKALDSLTRLYTGVMRSRMEGKLAERPLIVVKSWMPDMEVEDDVS